MRDKAIKSHSIEAVKISIDEYKAKLYDVSQYAWGVQQLSLPILFVPDLFPKWDEFQKTFYKTKESAQQWGDKVYIPLIETPNYICGQNEEIVSLLKRANTYAKDLNNPEISDNEKKDITLQMRRRLEDTLYVLGSTEKKVNNIITDMSNYNGSLKKQAAQLAILAAQSTVGAEVDKKAIKEINKKIEYLKEDVDRLTNQLIIDGVLVAGSIGFAIIGGLAGGAGWIIAIGWGIVAIVGIARIVLDAGTLVAEKAAITALGKALKPISKDSVTLEQTANTFLDLVTKAENAKISLTQIINVWTDIKEPIKQAIEDCITAENDLSQKAYSELSKDIVNIYEEWNKVLDQVKPLTTDMEFIEADLEIGMSNEEIEKALAEAQKIPVQELFMMQSA